MEDNDRDYGSQLVAKQADQGYEASYMAADLPPAMDSNNHYNAPPVPGGESDEEDEDAYYENPIEVIKEFGNHPLMERAQKALIKELKDTNYRLNVDLLDKKEDLKRLTAERETLGVQLYGLQQQLARIQLSLENAHNEFNRIVDSRLSEEELLKDVNKNNAEQIALRDEYKKQQKKYAAELDALNETIRQIQLYNEQVKSEIAISRRAAYKTEQNMQEIEKMKENQDMYVDSLNRQITTLKEQIEFVTKQFEIQKQETSDAATIVMETVQEIERIATEKQQLMIQWKAALSGLSRRDEALAQASITLAAAESAVHDYDVEIESARREVQKEQGKHETLVNLRDRLENELSWVEEGLNKIRSERAALQERYTLLSKSLAQTENDGKKLDLVTKNINNEAESVMSNLQVVRQERQKMDEELQILHSTYSNVNKAVTNLDRDAGKLMKNIHEKENEVIEIENQIARIQVDKLNVMTVNDQLKEQLDVATKEMKEKEALASKYQLEIRQRNDEIEKKMYRVDRLNKKYEKMVESAGGEENLGPMENTIKNLNKEIETMTYECKEFEREWLKKQTEMVTMSAECEKLTERNNEQQARVTVLSQQQIRLTKDLRELTTNLKVARNLNNDYQKDISKLNTLISNNHEQETGLQAQNFIIEMDCVQELKDAEHECITLQQTMHEVRNAKAQLLDEIVEMERQAMLWEKKIQLDKETKAALDPSVGVTENDNMEKEIHRMELRFEALKREQERLSIEMERAITKRATISTRYSTSTAAAANKKTTGGTVNLRNTAKELTQATAKKRIGDLKKDSRVLAEETSQYSSMYEEKKKQVQDIAFELEKVTAQYGEAEEQCHQLQGNINDLLYQKQLVQERIGYRQKYVNRLRDVSNAGSIEVSQGLQIERKLLSSTQALDNVKEIIQELQANFPHLQDVLQRVYTMTDPAIPGTSSGGDMQ